MFAFACGTRSIPGSCSRATGSARAPVRRSQRQRFAELRVQLAGTPAQRADDREVDPTALTEYLRYGYVPSPRTISPRSEARARTSLTWIPSGSVRIDRFWTLDYQSRTSDLVPRSARGVPARASLAVRKTARVRCALGFFLSGGVDSELHPGADGRGRGACRGDVLDWVRRRSLLRRAQRG